MVEIENPPSITISPGLHIAVDVIGILIPPPKLAGIPVTGYSLEEFIWLGPAGPGKPFVPLIPFVPLKPLSPCGPGTGTCWTC